MLKRKFASRRYNFLLAAGCIIIVFAAFSFTEKGESSVNSFRGFCEAEVQTGSDNFFQRTTYQGNSLDDTSILPGRTIERQIEEALQHVEERLERLEAELNERYVERSAKNAYKLALDNINLKRIGDETQHSLLQAQAQYEKVMKQFQIDNEKRMIDVQMQMDKARQLALNYDHNLRLNIEGKVRLNLEKVKENMRKANEKLKTIRDFRSDLEKDGLIKRDGTYLVEIKDGILYINGEKQSKSVNKKYKDKYKEYFNAENQFKLQLNGKNNEREREHGLI